MPIDDRPVQWSAWRAVVEELQRFFTLRHLAKVLLIYLLAVILGVAILLVAALIWQL